MSSVEYIKLDSQSGVEVFEVRVEGRPAFVVRFELYSLLTSTYYVKLVMREPILLLGVAALREMKRTFNSLTAKQFFCQCEVNNVQALHFAEFFGFKKVERIDERWHMEKN